MCDQQSLRSAYAYVQSDQSLCKSLEYSVSVKLLTEHHLEFLSLKGGCTGSSECTLVKMPPCWESHGAAQMCVLISNDVIYVANKMDFNTFICVLLPFFLLLRMNVNSYLSFVGLGKEH